MVTEKINHICGNISDTTLCGLARDSNDYSIVDDERNITCERCLEINLKIKQDLFKRLSDKEIPIQPPIDRFG